MNNKEKKVLEELKKGKSIREAAAIASTLEILVKRWIRLGSEGDPEYAEFYNEYQKITGIGETSKKDENEELIDSCVDLLNSGTHYKEIPDILNIPEFKLKNFFNQGRLGIKPYDKYYKASKAAEQRFIKEREKNKSPEETKESDINKKLKELDLKELDFILEDNNSFQIIPNKQRKIRTIKEEISNEDISKSLDKLEEIKNTENKIKKQLNKFNIKTLLGYLNDRDQILFTNKPRKKIVKKIIRDLKFSEMEEFYDGLFKIRTVEIEEEPDEETHIDESQLKEEADEKKCVVCGKPLNPLTKKDKCKSCLRSIHAANTLNELLNYIEPQIPFYIEDLKKLGYHKEKLLDTKWVLQENDLLIEESANKYSLVKREKLDEFLDKWEEYVEEKDADITAKLSKECIICKKTFAISQFGQTTSSEDGYKDYCKNCEKDVNAARSLKTLLNYVKPKEVFKKEEIYHNYSEAFLLDSSIFLLQEHDLIDTNPDGERFRLKEKEILDDFLDKYYIEEEEKPPKTEPIFEPKIEEPKPKVEETEDNRELIQKMDVVLYYLKEGFTEKEAFNFADLNKSTLITWKNLGRRGKEPYDHFYAEYKNLKKTGIIEEEYEFKYNKNRHEIVLNAIREGKTRKEAAKLAGVSVKDMDKWYSLGKYNKMEPYRTYYEEYQNIRNGIVSGKKTIPEEKGKIIDGEEREIKEKMNFFTDEIIKTGSVKVAFNNSNISKEEFINWFNLGNSGETFYKNFINQYLNSLKFVINDKIKDLRMKEANKLMIQGYNINDAVKEANKIDYTKKEKELQKKLTKEGEDLIKGVVIEVSKDTLKKEKYGLKFKIASENKDAESKTLIISGKIEKENLISIFDKLSEYQREINKILTNGCDNGHDIFIELEISNDEIKNIRSLLSEF